MVNVIIDVETLYYMIHGTPPLHRFLHTFFGTTFAVIATMALFVVCRWVANRYWLPNLFGWRVLSLGSEIIGAVIGAWSHVVLDGIMHSDMRPFAPFSTSNPMYRLIDLDVLHQGCMVSGVVGLAYAGLRLLLNRTNEQRGTGQRSRL